MSRPRLLEGEDAILMSQLAQATSIDAGRLQQLIESRSNRLRVDLSLKADPFQFSGAAVATRGVAGILQITPNTEIEIVPKCFAPEHTDWREDFLLMAAIMKYGRLFRRERISASHRDSHDDLLSLLAEIFVVELERLMRVPMREYSRHKWTDLSIDGELDYAELWDMGPDGFLQTGSRLFRRTTHIWLRSARQPHA